MHLSVISPEDFPSREAEILAGLFAAGLERYHVRKPRASADALGRWLRALPPEWRSRLVLHSHHHLVDTLGLGGRHEGEREAGAVTSAAPGGSVAAAVPPPSLISRACHDLPSLRQALGRYDIVLVSPIFPSLSKPGHGPNDRLPHDKLHSMLTNRTAAERRTRVFALAGVTAKRIPLCRELGFDGVAALGSIWHAPDPIAAFVALRDAGRNAPLAGARRHNAVVL